MTARGTVAVLVLLSLAAVACGHTAVPSRAVPPAITDRDWELIALGEESHPRGAGGRPVTLRLDAVSARAPGFAGCNRYSAGYTLSGDRLTFGPAVATKMACPQGMELERAFLTALPTVTTYEATGSSLVLRGSEGPIARFRAL